MANEEHLGILKQGARVWNKWRKRYKDVVPDLSRACLETKNLREANLAQADLSEADLTRANLREANLERTTLENTNLEGAILIGANLRRAILRGAILRSANIKSANIRLANLKGAILENAQLEGANLKGASLQGATLKGARLRSTNLSYTNLSRRHFTGIDLVSANLEGVNFEGANLQGTNFTGASLKEAILEGANLSHAMLEKTDLRGSNLIDAKLDGAICTNAKLWESQRGGWSIKGVICERAFWDREGKEATHYVPGEFERLYQEGLEIEIHYQGGISRMEMLTLPMLLQYLETEHKGCALRLKSIEDAPGGAKARIVIDETGDTEPKQLHATLLDQTQKLQKIQRALVEERKVRAELEDQSKQFKSQVEVLRDIVITTMRESTQIHIENIERAGVVGSLSERSSAIVDQSIKSTRDEGSTD